MSDIVRISCVKDGCGTFPMDGALVEDLKRSGRSFSCPAGHEQHFTESVEQQLRDRIDSLETKLGRARRQRDQSRDRVHDLYDDYRMEKDRRKYAESRLLDYADGVVEVADGEYKWTCDCGSRGQKPFSDVEDCRSAFDRHRRRNCPIEDSTDATTPTAGTGGGQ